MTTTVTGMLEEEASITVQFCWVYPSKHKPSVARRAWWRQRRQRPPRLAGWVGGWTTGWHRQWGYFKLHSIGAAAASCSSIYTDCWCASQSRGDGGGARSGGGSSRATKMRQSFEARHELHSFSSFTNSDFIVFSLLISITISFLKAGWFPFPVLHLKKNLLWQLYSLYKHLRFSSIDYE